MRKIAPLFAIAALSAFTLGAAAYAAPGGAFRHDGPSKAPATRAEAQARADQFFARLDANGDGVLDQNDRAARQTQRFARLDTDHNGSLSPQEFAAAGPRGPKGPSAFGPPPGGPPPEGVEGRGSGPRGPGFAGPHRGHPGFGGFGSGPMAHAGKDGPVTKAVFEAATLARFDAADTNHDGTLSDDERKAAMQAHRGERREQWRARRDGDTKAAPAAPAGQ